MIKEVRKDCKKPQNQKQNLKKYFKALKKKIDQWKTESVLEDE